MAEKAELPGSKWVVTGYNNGKEAVTVPAVDSTLTVEFGTDGKVGGDGGVNTFSGRLRVRALSVKIGPLASTKMAGPPELMTQEAAYLTALQNATTWEISVGHAHDARRERGDAGPRHQAVAPAATSS